MKPDFDQFKKNIKGKKVAVAGVGVSNIPLIKYLLKMGAKVTAFDKRPMEELDSKVNEFKDYINWSLGESYLDNLKGFDYIFKTPFMRYDIDVLNKAREEGTIITSEIEEFLRYCKGKIFGVTGSDGKSTSTTLIYEILKEEGYTTYIGGNIGFPLFDKLDEIQEEDMVVVELSSFQLMKIGISPEVAIVTNVTPNHLDMHKDMQEYIDAKKEIFKYQDSDSLLILNKDNELTRSFAKEAKGEVRFFSSKEKADAYYKDDVIYLNDKEVIRLSQMKLLGVHNAENLCDAILATKDYVSLDTVRKVAKTFNGVKHRAQFIKEIKGVKYYNDSIASSPTRTIATLSSLKNYHGKINVILGGHDKNLSYTELGKVLSKIAKNAVIVGESKEKMVKEFKSLNDEVLNSKIHEAITFEEAVKMAHDLAKNGEIVILSPACASFDFFRNFEKRGEKFVEIVNTLK